jgi:hypothetical protein
MPDRMVWARNRLGTHFFLKVKPSAQNGRAENGAPEPRFGPDKRSRELNGK